MNSSDNKLLSKITPTQWEHRPNNDESKPDRPDSLGNGRYKIGAMMGRGGFGAVYEGHDQLTGQRIAIKLMGEAYGKQMTYTWREAALLRLLQLPGVVQLLEEGEEHDTSYMVMELVEGTPFPGEGARGDWSKIEGPLRQLLAALERVHLEGIVHRDLKPHNVLVRADGSVVLLDFGLSMDPNLYTHLTATPSSITGTPAYLAPEQWRSEPASRQTDLWAVGIMLYEALCKKLPFSSSHMLDVMREILAGKLTLESLPSDVPGHVIWLMHSLLATSPHERPASAGDALDALDGGPIQRRHQLPLIGRDETRARIVELLQDGHSVRLIGKDGCGRTRMLQEVREGLGRLGCFTLRLWPAQQPLHSLRELLPPGPLDAANAQLAQTQLADALASRMIILAEDLDSLDAITRELIRPQLPDYPILLGVATRGVTQQDVELAPLSEQQLSALFGGHERVFRMRSGGAHELWRRTGGNASLVARELDGWVQAHMARWHSDKLVLEPDALPRLRAGLQVIEPQRERPQDTIEERLQAWLYLTQPEADPSFMSNLLDISSAEVSAHIDMLATRGDIQRDESGAVFVHKAAWMEQALPEAMRIDAHRSIATALPQGHPRRLYHLVAAGEQTSVVDEQLAQALRWDEQGMVQRALLTLDDSIKAARAQRTRLDETPLLLAASRIALASGSKRDLERLLYALDATPHPTHLVQTCTCLVSIALQIIQGASLKGLEALEELIVIFEDDELELRRCQWRWRACQALPMEVAETTIKDIGQWAESTQDENIEGTYLGWLGTLRYRQQRFEEAARLHIRAASLKHRPTARISSWLNATVAFESALLLEDAWHTCEQARRQAILCEHRDYELYASAFARQLAYRRDEPLEPDPELLEVMRVSGALANMASIIVVETMILWRSGDREGARRLASEGLNVYANLGLRSVTIVACLIAALDERVTITERLWEEVRQLEMPRLLVQCAGILATRQTPPDDILELVRQRADAVPPEHWHTRLEMNSFAQAFDQLGLATPDHVARSLAAQRT